MNIEGGTNDKQQNEDKGNVCLEYLMFLKENKNYRFYYLAHICQHLGDAMVRVATLLTVEFVAPNSGTAVSMLLMCETISELVVTPVSCLSRLTTTFRKLIDFLMFTHFS